jgi:formylglycine-generating enzyme required for sulfatase activity
LKPARTAHLAARRRLAVAGAWSALLVLALAAGCRRALNNPADPDAPAHTGEPVRVDAGPELAASIGDTILFAGRFTGDTARVAEYAWDFDGDGRIDWRSRETGEALGALRAVGEYRARFVVRGAIGDEESATALVRITDEPPHGGIGPDTLLVPGDTLRVVPAVQDDGRIVRYEWDLDGDGRFERVAADPSTLAATFADSGEFVVALRVVDDDGRAALFGRRVGICALPGVVDAADPADGARDVSIRQTLRWSGDADCGAPLQFDVRLDTANPPTRVVLLRSPLAAFHAGLLLHGRTYYWQVTVEDAAGRRRAGGVLSFRTRAVPAGMAYLLPATVPIGSDRNANESPRHFATIDGVYIDRRETTRDEFAEFLAATGWAPRGTFRADEPVSGVLPATGVTWEDATAYAAWRGKRLPTEAEWEYAARGPSNVAFPWGVGIPLRPCDHANAMRTPEVACVGALAPVGARPMGQSWAGVDDLAGNAAEWVADWYAEDYYLDPLSGVLPTGPETGTLKSVRGGSFRTLLTDCTVSRRVAAAPDSSSDEIGFRCALSIDAPAAPPASASE